MGRSQAGQCRETPLHSWARPNKLSSKTGYCGLGRHCWYCYTREALEVSCKLTAAASALMNFMCRILYWKGNVSHVPLSHVLVMFTTASEAAVQMHVSIVLHYVMAVNLFYEVRQLACFWVFRLQLAM